nr:ribosomal protein L22 [Cryptomonas sp. NIES-345]BDA98445.1 ribosomal protein S22 [Cryptomonas sp. NIES-1327]
MVKATAKYIRMTPNKIRRVVNQIRGKSYKEALMILEFMPYAACKPVLVLLQSAGANAETNYGMRKSGLRITEVYVDPGPILKRFRPRAQGRGYKIQKLTSHICLRLSKIEGT